MKATLQILICAIDKDISQVADVLLPPMEGIGYVVSVQYTNEAYLKSIPDVLYSRDDLVVTTLPGRGLSRNRNNAILHANADILITADADNRYTAEELKAVLDTFEQHPEADIICFKAQSYDSKPMKRYPTAAIDFVTACKQGYYPSSHEIVIRKHVDVRFDGRFGLGSEKLCAGEEDVFLKDAMDNGYSILFVPKCIVSTDPDTTGDHFVDNQKLQLTKGAVFKHLFGTRNAVWRSVREAGYHFLHNGANPLTIFHRMLQGIWMFR